MSYRKKIIILIILILIIPLISFLNLYFNKMIYCTSYSCYNFLFLEEYIYLFFLPFFIIVSSLFSLIFSERVNKIWQKFSFVFIPLMIIGIFIIKVDPPECGFICIDRGAMTILLGSLYLILSFLILISSAIYFKIKSKNTAL